MHEMMRGKEKIKEVAHKRIIKGVEKIWEENEKKITKGEGGNQQKNNRRKDKERTLYSVQEERTG